VTRVGVSAERANGRAWLAWAAVCLIWGTTFLAIKVALRTVPPFLVGGLRYVTGGAILAGLLAARGRRLPARREWGRLAILGFFMLMMGNGGVVWGEQYVPSGLAAVLIGANPFWMVSVDAILPGGVRLRGRRWVGLVVGFSGIVMLVWPDITRGGADGRAFAIGVLSVQIACAGWAVGSGYTRRHVLSGDVLGSAALQMVFGGAFMLTAGTLLGEWGALRFTGQTATALVYLTIAGSVVAFAAYSYALHHLDVAVVSLYSYINPIIAVILGILVLGETFQPRMLAAVAVIATGIAIVGPIGRRRG
jgi:drug/metabolite transporter (DMT)-like permease